MHRIIIKTGIIICIFLISCNPSTTTVSDVIDDNLSATTNQADWTDFKSQKSYLKFKIKIGGNVVNSVNQVMSTQGNAYQKTETFQNDILSEMTLTNKGKSAMVKFENGEFYGVNEIPTETVNLTPLSTLIKNQSDFFLKDTLWSEKPVYQLVNDSLDETYTFDQVSKYLIAFTSQNMYGKSTTTYSDYKEVDGYILPFKEVTSIPEAGYEIEMIYSEIEVNPEFSANYFDLDPSWNRLTKGQNIPDFELPYVLSEDKFVTHQNLKGKIVLIDFWATWCKPCIEEFPSIKENYKTYKDKGFEVVSISVDKDKDRLLKFLEKNPFPWKYSLYSEGELKSELAKKFQIVALPRQILIEENGKIIAMDAELRDGKLKNILKTLTKN